MTVDFDVYLITDRKKGPRETFFDSIESALRSGIRAIQLREKDLTVKELLDYALKVREMTGRYNAKFLVNDRVDVAMAVGADGAHVGRQSMSAGAIRKIAGKDFLIGVSAHNMDESMEAQRDGADFITFGPVYETPSKIKYGKPVGVVALRDVVKKVNIPVFALGGIHEKNIPEVMTAGVTGVAMISAIWGADNIEKKTKEIVRLVE